MSAPSLSVLDALGGRYAAQQAQLDLEDASVLLGQIADMISDTPEEDAAAHHHLWAASIRFVGRSLGHSASFVDGWLKNRSEKAPEDAAQSNSDP